MFAVIIVTRLTWIISHLSSPSDQRPFTAMIGRLPEIYFMFDFPVLFFVLVMSVIHGLSNRQEFVKKSADLALALSALVAAIGTFFKTDAFSIILVSTPEHPVSGFTEHFAVLICAALCAKIAVSVNAFIINANRCSKASGSTSTR